MMKNNIYIVTGKVQTGKTTRLFDFARKQKSINGILAPIVNGKRTLYHISSKQLEFLEVDYSNSSTITVGKYHFLKETFTWAKEKLIESIKDNPEWLIIDEVGKLELNNEGLQPAITEVIDLSKNVDTKIILVIRDYLLDEVLKMLEINKAKVKNLEI